MVGRRTYRGSTSLLNDDKARDLFLRAFRMTSVVMWLDAIRCLSCEEGSPKVPVPFVRGDRVFCRWEGPDYCERDLASECPRDTHVVPPPANSGTWNSLEGLAHLAVAVRGVHGAETAPSAQGPSSHCFTQISGCKDLYR